MAVGLPMKTTYANGDVFSASDVNDITGTVNLVGQTTNFYAGKNKIINGDFGVWQRGTTFTNATVNTYTSDRWFFGGSGNNTGSISRQTFTPGTAPVAGYEAPYFFRFDQTSTAITPNLQTRIEDVRTFAGQTVTLSFWVKTSAAVTGGLTNIYLEQMFGSGGSGSVATLIVNTTNTTTSWTRVTGTATLPSVAGKTIGTGSYLQLTIYPKASTVITLDIWGVQLEAGSTATAFQTATGTIQGELAACQRYYYRKNASSSGPYAVFAFGAGVETSTAAVGYVQVPVPLRSYPSSIEYGGTLRIIPFAGAESNVSAIGLGDRTGTETISINFTGSGMSSGAYCFIRANNSSTAYLGINAEL